jgi:protein-tyrosine phosphatase
LKARAYGFIRQFSIMTAPIQDHKETGMVRVLFVCMGNICRSPMAEAVFQHMVTQAGLGDKIKIDSAGLGDWHTGQSAHPGTLQILRANNIPYNGRARQIVRQDLDDFDYVLVMDRENLSSLRRYTVGTRAHVGLFLQYAKQAGLVNVDEVPDPYFDGTFDYVYGLVTKGNQALLDHIREEQGI